MITEEQIKKLKPGDPLIVHGKFDSIYDDGDLCIDIKARDAFSDEVIRDSMYVHPSCVSMPPEKPIEIFHTTKIPEEYPKYDPCRLFKAGDIVEPCQVKGRWFGTAWKNRSGIRFTVTKDEDEEGVMWVKDPDSLHSKDVEAVFFRLVTPVEELEPYFVMELKGAYGVYNTRFQPETEACHFFTDMHPHAKEAADAECARLNAEHRKEQSNG